MSNPVVKVMIVDDSQTQRTFLRQALESEPGIQILSHAANGRLALPRFRYYKPDVVILDQEMPELNGLQTLAVLRRDFPAIRVVMYCAPTRHSARMTIQALQQGAHDFVTKPVNGQEDPTEHIRLRLIPHILSFRKTEAESQRTISTNSDPAQPAATRTIVTQTGLHDVAAIGISTGGPQALRDVFVLLGSIRGSILICQHMPPLFTEQLAKTLSEESQISVAEGRDGEPVQSGHAYIAPGGRHMIVERCAEGPIIRILDVEPEMNCRPSANVLFRSVAQVYGTRAVGIIMTGMGSDGLLGMREMAAAGCHLIGQAENSCLIYSMPAGPIREKLVHEVLDVRGIARRLSELLGGTHGN